MRTPISPDPRGPMLVCRQQGGNYAQPGRGIPRSMVNQGRRYLAHTVARPPLKFHQRQTGADLPVPSPNTSRSSVAGIEALIRSAMVSGPRCSGRALMIASWLSNGSGSAACRRRRRRAGRGRCGPELRSCHFRDLTGSHDLADVLNHCGTSTPLWRLLSQHSGT